MIAFNTLSAVLLVASFASKGPFVEGEICPGCNDTSPGATTGSNPCVTAGYNSGVVITVTHYSGKCWMVSSDCVMSVPCTPYLKVEAWVDDPFCGGYFHSAGQINGIGTGRVKVGTLGQGESYPSTLYEDYSEVNCGSSLAMSWQVAYYETLCISPSHHEYVCTITAGGSLSCDACHQES